MTLKQRLGAIVSVIVEEAARNPAFRDRIEFALDLGKSATKAVVKDVTGLKSDEKRKGGRRTPAVLDPIDLAKLGEKHLRDKLAPLDAEKLLDIVAQYGMDPGKLVMKWKDRERIVDRIVELAIGRSTKGDAFRKD